jgi:dTMP kinase
VKNSLHIGMLIVLEGIDGTGKSTLAKKLAEYFESIGQEVVLSHEPTNGKWGQKIRATATTGRLSAAEELDYFLLDRKEHVANLINPSIAAGKVVILDRYYFSNIAYQGARGANQQEIRQQNEDFAPKPDLLFILDLDVDTALTRINARDSANEFEKRDNLQRCRDIFLTFNDEPFAHVIDAKNSSEIVAKEAIQLLESTK